MRRGDGQPDGLDLGEGLALGEGPLARRHKYQNSRSFTPLSDSVAAWGAALGRQFQPPPAAPATAPRAAAAAAAAAAVDRPLSASQVGALPTLIQQYSSYRHGQIELCPQGSSSMPITAVDISRGPGHQAASSRRSSTQCERQHQEQPWGRMPQIDADINHQAAQGSQHMSFPKGFPMEQPRSLPAEPPTPSSPSGTAWPDNMPMRGCNAAAAGSRVAAEEAHQSCQGQPASWGEAPCEASSQPGEEPPVQIEAVMAGLRSATAAGLSDRAANTDTAGMAPSPPGKTAPTMSPGTSS